MKGTYIDDEYVRDVERFDLLTAAEECAAAESGDIDALVNHNLRLVVSIAQRYAGLLPMMDMIQEGNIGLMQAAQHYDPARGTKFGTYATYWIKHAIVAAIAAQAGPIKVPGRVNTAVRKCINAEQAYVTKYGVEPTDAQLAETIQASVEDVREWRRIADLTILSLDAGDDCDIYDMIPGGEEPETILISEMASDISAALDTLTDGERYAVTYIYGLDGVGTHTQAEAADLMGLSQQRVSQLEKSAIRKLQDSGVLTQWVNLHD